MKRDVPHAGDGMNVDEQCIVCGKLTTFCCSKCRRVFYCSQACQRVDWRSHKITCSEVRDIKGHDPRLIYSAESRKLPVATSGMSMHDKASEIFKECLMSRFGSIVGAYEWFDINRNGTVDYSEFQKMVVAANSSMDLMYVRELFAALDRNGDGKLSLSEFLNDAVQRLRTPSSTKIENSATPSPVVSVQLSPARRALRTAALLAFRNGRYNDAIVAAQQALGITSASLKSSLIAAHPDNLVEVLLLCRAFAVSNPMKGEPLLELLQTILPPDQPTTFPAHVEATLLCSIAEIFDSYNKSPTAALYYQQYLRRLSDHFTTDSLVFSDGLTLASAFYLRSGQVEEAVEATRRAKEIRSAQLPAPHARVADALNNFGIALKMHAQLEKAIPAFAAAWEMRVALFGAVSVPAADSEFSLGSCHLALHYVSVGGGHDSRAVLHLTSAHAVRLKLLGPSHPDSLIAAETLRQAVQAKASNKNLPPPQGTLLNATLEENAVMHAVVAEELNLNPNDAETESETASDMVAEEPVTQMRKSAHFFDGTVVFPPGSVFADALARQGQEGFLESLRLMDAKGLLSGKPDFDLAPSLPRGGAPWISLALKLVFAKRLLEEPALLTHDEELVETLFKSIKKSETSLGVIFGILNTINSKINQQRSAPLNIDSFSIFVNSRTPNVSLVQYFVDTLSAEKPELVDDFLYDLSVLPEANEVDVAAHIFQAETRLRSLALVVASLKEAGDPKEAAVLEQGRLMKDELESRMALEKSKLKDMAEGIAVVCELFDLPSDQVGKQINTALDLLLEFYQLVDHLVHPEGSSEGSGESEGSEESDEESSQAADSIGDELAPQPHR